MVQYVLFALLMIVMLVVLVKMFYISKDLKNLSKENLSLKSQVENVFDGIAEYHNSAKLFNTEQLDKIGVTRTDIIECIKRSLDEQIQQMKLVEKLNTSNTKDMLSTITKDLTSSLTDIINKLAAHDNYVAANNKVTRPMLSELLEAIKSFVKAEQEKGLDTATKEVEKPKTVIRRNKRKYTKDTEEVKE